ncbi:MAG: DMT family transporter, partial [Gammaproteobacteria bacterium]
MPTARHNKHLLRGALLVIAAELMFASMGAVIKGLSTDLPTEMLVFFRNAFGLLFLLPLLARRGVPSLATRVPHLHLLRALSGLSAMYCFFYALSELQLANAVILKLTAPIFIPVIAAAWLREEISLGIVAAVIAGFVGVALIVRPPGGHLDAVAFIGLAGGALVALAKVTIRRLTRTEPATRIVFYFGLVATVVSVVPLAWAWRAPSPREWAMLALLGVLATSGQLLMTRGYASAPAARIGTFTYASVLFAAAYGWLARYRQAPRTRALLLQRFGKPNVLI